MSTMLYKKGTMLYLEGKELDYKIVKDEEIESSLKNGWVKHPSEIEDMSGNPTRSEMEEKAKELGISFRSNTPNETILKKIEEALNGIH